MYAVYITTNVARTVLYTGVTNNLANRLIQHFNNRGEFKSFSGRDSCYNLIYYEEYSHVVEAIKREKEIKNRPRQWKEALISFQNPTWTFMNEAIFGEWPPF